MNHARSTFQQMPSSARICLSSLLMLGVLAMHTVVASDEGTVAHHASSVSDLSNVPELVPLGGMPDVSTSDCGGLSMLCMAMIVGLSAHIVLRRRSLDRVLWQLPPLRDMALGRAIAPFPSLIPRERNPVLRC